MIVMFACSGTQNKNENYYAKVLTLNPDDRQPCLLYTSDAADD